MSNQNVSIQAQKAISNFSNLFGNKKNQVAEQKSFTINKPRVEDGHVVYTATEPILSNKNSTKSTSNSDTSAVNGFKSFLKAAGVKNLKDSKTTEEYNVKVALDNLKPEMSFSGSIQYTVDHDYFVFPQSYLADLSETFQDSFTGSLVLDRDSFDATFATKLAKVDNSFDVYWQLLSSINGQKNLKRLTTVNTFVFPKLQNLPKSDLTVKSTNILATALDNLIGKDFFAKSTNTLLQSSVVSYENYLTKSLTKVNPHNDAQSFGDFLKDVFTVDLLKEVGEVLLDAVKQYGKDLLSSLIPSFNLPIKDLTKLGNDYKGIVTGTSTDSELTAKGRLGADLGLSAEKEKAFQDSIKTKDAPQVVDAASLVNTKFANWQAASVNVETVNDYNVPLLEKVVKTVKDDNGNTINLYEYKVVETVNKKFKEHPAELYDGILKQDWKNSKHVKSNLARFVEFALLGEAGIVEKTDKDYIEAQSQLFDNFVAQNALLGQHQYRLNIGQATFAEISEDLYNDFQFRARGIELPDLQRPVTDSLYGHTVLSMHSSLQANSEHSANITFICDRNFKTLEYLSRLAGLAIKVDDHYNLSTVYDSSYTEDNDTTATIYIDNGRTLAKAVNFENREWQFEKEAPIAANLGLNGVVANEATKQEVPKVTYAKLPVFLLEHFRIINLDYSFKFDSTSVDSKLFEIKATVTWTKVKVKWETPADIFYSPIGKSTSASEATTPTIES